MPANTAIHPPPRPTCTDCEDAAGMLADLRALHEWAQKFYESAVVEAKLLDPSHQANPGTFDADNLPDPTENTSLAVATDVAVRAYQLAQSLVP